MSIDKNFEISFDNSTAIIRLAGLGLANFTRRYQPSWDFRTTIGLIIDLCAFFLNLLVVILFCKTATLRTSFNFFLVNLCAANLLFSSVVFIIDTVNNFFPSQHPPASFCAAVRYLNPLGGAALNNSHLLIALNRLWAVMWPNSYRQFHFSSSLKKPVLLCAAMWVYIQAWILPGIIVDMGLRETPETFRCSTIVIGQPAVAIALNIILFDLPIAVMCFTYPFILRKVLSRSRNKRLRVSPSVPDAAEPGVGRSSRHRYADVERDLAVPRATFSVQRHGDENRMSEIRNALLCCRKRTPNDKSNGSLLTLTSLILVVIILLLPIQIYYTMMTFGFRVRRMYPVVAILYSLSPVFDPLSCLFTVKSFRDALRAVFRRP